MAGGEARGLVLVGRVVAAGARGAGDLTLPDLPAVGTGHGRVFQGLVRLRLVDDGVLPAADGALVGVAAAFRIDGLGPAAGRGGRGRGDAGIRGGAHRGRAPLRVRPPRPSE